MNVQVYAAAGVGALIVLLLVLTIGMLRRPRTDLDRFAAARELTSRWAADPTTSPAPIKDIARRARDNEDLVSN